MGNLWRITWSYSNRADYVAIEPVGHANWLHERLHTMPGAVAPEVMAVTAEPVNGDGKPWEWLNSEAGYRPAHARNSVDSGAQGI